MRHLRIRCRPRNHKRFPRLKFFPERLLGVYRAWPHMRIGKRILVLDDDASVLGALERVLKVHGFNAEVFDTVEGFLGSARPSDASCLVLDIDLDGTSGI